jgi:hypothetical protein
LPSQSLNIHLFGFITKATYETPARQVANIQLADVSGKIDITMLDPPTDCNLLNFKGKHMVIIGADCTCNSEGTFRKITVKGSAIVCINSVKPPSEIEILWDQLSRSEEQMDVRANATKESNQ